MNIPSKTFCILPWIHTYVNADGAVLPCCIGNHHSSLGNVQSDSVISIWNNDRYKDLRSKMLTGREDSACSACYETERRGLTSARQSNNIDPDYIKYFDLVNKTNPDGSLDEFSLKYFDVRWSNICNFKCRSCSATYSSSWATEDNNKNYKQKVFIFAGGANNDELYNQFQPYFTQIEKFYFAGGEPLLTDKHYDILNYLIDNNRTHVKLIYNTNLSNLEFKGQSVIDLWNKFSQVEIRASLDSWGDRAEYIRDGTNWAKIETNIKQIQKYAPHVNLQINCVVSVFNIATVPEFLSYLTDNKIFNITKFDPHFYNIINPLYYSADVIPNDIKDNVIKKLKNFHLTDHVRMKLKDTVLYLENSTYNKNLHRKFLENTDTYDTIRNQNFVKTFPELKDLYSL